MNSVFFIENNSKYIVYTRMKIFFSSSTNMIFIIKEHSIFSLKPCELCATSSLSSYFAEKMIIKQITKSRTRYLQTSASTINFTWRRTSPIKIFNKILNFKISEYSYHKRSSTTKVIRRASQVELFEKHKIYSDLLK